jgi:hypothetical protein
MAPRWCGGDGSWNMCSESVGVRSVAGRVAKVGVVSQCIHPSRPRLGVFGEAMNEAWFVEVLGNVGRTMPAARSASSSGHGWTTAIVSRLLQGGGPGRGWV